MQIHCPQVHQIQNPVLARRQATSSAKMTHGCGTVAAGVEPGMEVLVSNASFTIEGIF